MNAKGVPEDQRYAFIQAIDKSEREPREKTAEKLGPLADGGLRHPRRRRQRQKRAPRHGRGRPAPSRPAGLREARLHRRARPRLLHRRRLRGLRPHAANSAPSPAAAATTRCSRTSAASTSPPSASAWATWCSGRFSRRSNWNPRQIRELEFTSSLPMRPFARKPWRLLQDLREHFDYRRSIHF